MFSDSVSRGGDSAGHRVRGDIGGHDGSRGRFRQAGVQSQGPPQAQDRVETRGRQRNHSARTAVDEIQRCVQMCQGAATSAMREKRLITFVAFVLAVASYEGEMLSLVKVTRSEMGAYLCIAANGVPPSVSKRMMVHIHCEFRPFDIFYLKDTLKHIHTATPRVDMRAKVDVGPKRLEIWIFRKFVNSNPGFVTRVDNILLCARGHNAINEVAEV